MVRAVDGGAMSSAVRVPLYVNGNPLGGSNALRGVNQIWNANAIHAPLHRARGCVVGGTEDKDPRLVCIDPHSAV